MKDLRLSASHAIFIDKLLTWLIFLTTAIKKIKRIGFFRMRLAKNHQLLRPCDYQNRQ